MLSLKKYLIIAIDLCEFNPKLRKKINKPHLCHLNGLGLSLIYLQYSVLHYLNLNFTAFLSVHVC